MQMMLSRCSETGAGDLYTLQEALRRSPQSNLEKKHFVLCEWKE